MVLIKSAPWFDSSNGSRNVSSDRSRLLKSVIQGGKIAVVKPESKSKPIAGTCLSFELDVGNNPDDSDYV